MCNRRLFTIGILTILTILVVLVMIYANTGIVNGENTNLGGIVSKRGIEDKTTKVEDPSKEFLISTLNVEGKESGGNDDECQDYTDCSNRNLDENTHTKEMPLSTEILLPFP
jgi:hypothetical protein